MLTSMPRNYTGDVLNFGLAKEQYAALHPEKAERIKFVIVGDDVAVGRAQGVIVGRRYENLNNRPSGNQHSSLQWTSGNRLGLQNCWCFSLSWWKS
jgi:hypothetical protein